MKKGFTLIEVIIYLALFGILIGGAVVASFSLFESSGRNSASVMLQEEGSFILAKISATLSGTQTITLPDENQSGSTLSVVKWDAGAGNPIVINVDGDNIVLSHLSNPGVPLNNSNVSITNLNFTHTKNLGEGTKPESVTSSFTASARTPNGQVVSKNFSNNDYLRK